MSRRIGLLFDCLRAPYDVAHILQVAVALGNCDLYTSGNSIDTNNKKIETKVRSWGIVDVPQFERFGSFEEAAYELHERNKYLVGTSHRAEVDIYDFDLAARDSVIVFGNETSGLTDRKVSLLDAMVRIPMDSSCKFFTLPTVVPIAAYEFYRQLRGREHV